MDTGMIMLLMSGLPMAPAPDTFARTPTYEFACKPQFRPVARRKFEGPFHRGANLMSWENEKISNRAMEKMTGLNCRRGLGMQKQNGNSSLSLTTSYGFGFYWTCCNRICAKSKVIGRLGGLMEISVKGPCKRKNSLAEDTCGECGHDVCGYCEKVAECSGTAATGKSSRNKPRGILRDPYPTTAAAINRKFGNGYVNM
ncbi:1a0e373c-d3ec-4530-8dc0-fb21c93044fc [Sclerotinia trifoliorum]|uniref:1a0e373c-d3ec-4530-8dc0-fb21c93044fc n=1 Tax=Sclerotinia trifoliorum TaxID=28548 RepID=A0A8H2ZWC3_9HELO|nr:1a0e373c-d3ec-4530-8dc0-fb21c93044fc [Sclerotinia trifoliorum]